MIIKLSTGETYHFNPTADVDVPAIFGSHVAGSYIECGLIDLATFIAREEGR